MVKFLYNAIVKASKSIRKNIREGKGLPPSVEMVDNNGKTHKLKLTEYLGVFQQMNIFILKHGRSPNFVQLNSKCSTLPIALNYQDTKYNCCPTSFSMATMCLFDYKSEKECVRALGTVQGSGTSPSKLVANAPKLGYTATPIKRNYQAVYESLKKGKPVIVHYETGGKTKPACMGFINNYGHYALIYWCKNNQYFIADPTKGFHRCYASVMDKATNGRDLKYYSISPK